MIKKDGLSTAVKTAVKKKQKNRKKKKEPPWKGKAQPAAANKKKKSREEEEVDDYESNTDEDYSDTQEERKDEYKKGGYHPVVEGELYNARYRVVKKLGWGYFSTVWLVWDHKETGFRAMKMQKSAEHYREAAFDEIKLLTQIRDGDVNNEKCCCRLTDHFEHRGPNGKHVAMVFEVLGENLLSLITKYDYKGIPLPIVKHISRQVLIGLDYMHRHLGIIHTDLKPENVLLSQPTTSVRTVIKTYKPPADALKQLGLADRDPSTLSKSQKKRLKKKQKAQAQKQTEPDSATQGAEGDDKDDDDEEEHNTTENDTTANNAHNHQDANLKDAADDEIKYDVKIADFGNGCWIDKQFTDEIQTRQYRAPEVILGEQYSTPVDMWSMACLVFELITGEFLFDPRHSEHYDRDEDHLALMIELLGKLPPHLARGNGKFRDKYLNHQGELKHINKLKFWPLEDVLHDKYNFTRIKAEEIASFLKPMLSIDPVTRATAQQLINHPWLQEQEDDLAPFCYRQEEPDDDRNSETQSDGDAEYADDEEEGEEELAALAHNEEDLELEDEEEDAS